jgi:hypothetical protein
MRIRVETHDFIVLDHFRPAPHFDRISRAFVASPPSSPVPRRGGMAWRTHDGRPLTGRSIVCEIAERAPSPARAAGGDALAAVVASVVRALDRYQHEPRLAP